MAGWQRPCREASSSCSDRKPPQAQAQAPPQQAPIASTVGCPSSIKGLDTQVLTSLTGDSTIPPKYTNSRLNSNHMTGHQLTINWQALSLLTGMIQDIQAWMMGMFFLKACTACRSSCATFCGFGDPSKDLKALYES